MDSFERQLGWLLFEPGLRSFLVPFTFSERNNEGEFKISRLCKYILSFEFSSILSAKRFVSKSDALVGCCSCMCYFTFTSYSSGLELLGSPESKKKTKKDH